MKKELKQEFPLFVRKSIIHRWVEVYYTVDYHRELISLVERDWSMKRWYFNDRWSNTNWKDIIEAMKKAVEQAENELKEFQEYKKERNLELIIEANETIKKTK